MTRLERSGIGAKVRDQNAPVLIIGGGPVGQTAALLLARWGVRSVLVEAQGQRTVQGSRAICHQRDVLDILDTVGVGQALAERGLTWTCSRTYLGETELSSWSFEDTGQSPFPPFVNVSQSTTEALLQEQILENELIEIRWSHEVTSITQDDAEVTLVCRTPHGPERIRGPWAICCAGARSDLLRTELGLTFDGQTFEDRFLICDIEVDLPHWEHERRYYFDPPWNPDRQVLIHPCPDHVYRIDWQVPSDFDIEAEESSGGLDERIRLIVGNVPYRIVWKSVYRFHARSVNSMRVGRVLVGGDSAHLVPPYGARGMNSGIQDAENIAWKLAWVLKGWAAEDLLDTFDAERQAATRENIDVTAATMKFTVPQTEQEWADRRVLLNTALSDPAVRDDIDTGRFAEPFWYIESSLTTPNSKLTFPGRPPKGHAPRVVPGVLIPDVAIRDANDPLVSRLRQLVRTGLLLITADEEGASEATSTLRLLTGAPQRCVSLESIDPDGDVAAVLDFQSDQWWLIRPDGHVAAVIDAHHHDALKDSVDRITRSTSTPHSSVYPNARPHSGQ